MNGDIEIRTQSVFIAVAIAVCVLLTACGAGGGDAAVAPSASMSAAAQLGEKIFNDPGLSASGTLACSGCHDPANAHAQPNTLAVALGGPGMNLEGFRNSPSLNYASFTPAFHFESDGTPVGGFNRDGRAVDFADQARRPFLSANEMANASVADVIARLATSPYNGEFRALFGADILDSPGDAFDRMVFALARYQTEDPDFRPFDSKYDFFLAGKATLTAQELRGLVMFNSPAKGNCAACHPSARGADGSPPLFTDFTYDNLGVPRNPDIGANADQAYFDLGLCGPFRTDLAARGDLCGAFKVPTLRNVDRTAPYFHNGRFATLKQAIEFYVRRDTNPEAFYPLDGGGQPDKFDDLPPAYRANVNTTEAPYNRHPGEAPALTDAEIDDLVAFLKTLNDGYTP
jgi:cytochrome c peroxidase